MRYTLQEHQGKRLFPKDGIDERHGVTAKINQESVKVLNESATGKRRKLIVQMEAIHVGRTANYTFYTKEGLQGGLESWTTPRPKPVLTHHNQYSGEPIGRILKAEFSDVTQSGKAGLMFTVEVTDPDAIEKVLDGRYQTVSIGASTDKVTCNICGTNRIEEWCDHYPGESYEGQTAHFIIGNTFGREVSYVNVPADEHAGNTSVTVVEGEEGGTKESIGMDIIQIAEGLYQTAANPHVNLYENAGQDLRSALDKLLTFEEGSKRPMKDEPEPENNQVPGATPEEGQQQPAATPPADPPATPPVSTTEGQDPPAATPADPPATPPAAPVQESVTDLKLRVTTLEGQNTNLTTENQRLTGELQTKEGEYQAALQENANLQSKIHRMLAEKVVDMKRSLNKPDVVGVDREEAVNSHVSRSKESLENTYNDLVAEAKQARPEPGSVTNPGAGAPGGSTEEGDKKPMTLADGVNMISSMFGGANKRKGR
ncbi:hypothetical protein GZH47_32790 (plasmid) [Paenibacillus rhizovicinus]|uniref:DUF2213 domain-containing protein n=1 Tax=Paenibacillus rhizovicinus TaxID=2704463 RepID=A0A6C0PAW5_9BACL|nr:hypothetical protein [Paenibacillus rhizovicinus]QHW35677.1 hypothetical protein GZH47_32790 [Paenibacillus rhizovicinus]